MDRGAERCRSNPDGCPEEVASEAAQGEGVDVDGRVERERASRLRTIETGSRRRRHSQGSQVPERPRLRHVQSQLTGGAGAANGMAGHGEQRQQPLDAVENGQRRPVYLALELIGKAQPGWRPDACQSVDRP